MDADLLAEVLLDALLELLLEGAAEGHLGKGLGRDVGLSRDHPTADADADGRRNHGVVRRHDAAKWYKYFSITS